MAVIDEDTELDNIDVTSSSEEADFENERLPEATVKSFGAAMVFAGARKDVSDSDGGYEDDDSDSVAESDEIMEFSADFTNDHSLPPKYGIPNQKSKPPRQKPGPKPKRSRARTSSSEDDEPNPQTCGNHTYLFFLLETDSV